MSNRVLNGSGIDQGSESREHAREQYEKFDIADLGINREIFLRDIAPLFETLEWDHYDVERGGLPQPCRKRAIATFDVKERVGGLEINQMPNQPYTQPTNHNTYNRTAPRVYPDVEDKYIHHPEMQKLHAAVLAMVKNRRPHAKHLRTIFTFTRTVVSDSHEGLCAMEGPHCDGMDYIVSALVINRKNIQEHSGESSVLTVDGSTCFKTVLQAGEGIFQDDHRLFHNITKIEKDPLSLETEGFRDIIGIDVIIEEQKNILFDSSSHLGQFDLHEPTRIACKNAQVAFANDHRLSGAYTFEENTYVDKTIWQLERGIQDTFFRFMDLFQSIKNITQIPLNPRTCILASQLKQDSEHHISDALTVAAAIDRNFDLIQTLRSAIGKIVQNTHRENLPAVDQLDQLDQHSNIQEHSYNDQTLECAYQDALRAIRDNKVNLLSITDQLRQKEV
ncbi:MAG TPA: 2OG-Fe dioxygenase family protein [Candidatus Peribacterales bacterium]|nr:2OG-Fe dioxygenase family protein [Candidatus Peribacterales bacterium]